MKQNLHNLKLPAEWARQSAVLLTWPHPGTDWAADMDEVIPCYVSIAKAIVKRERLLIVCRCIEEVKAVLGDLDYSRIIFREIPSNDTWARDHGPVSVFADNRPSILDFTFNGWGLKFPACCDNQITRRLYESNTFDDSVHYQSRLQVILEGGSIESDGEGTLMTTSGCLLSPNRNGYRNEKEAEHVLKKLFNLQRILWLRSGSLSGDDTDGHIDTLARFCNKETIAYVKCTDKNDEHFTELALMEEELKNFRTQEGKSYRLIALPMADAVYQEGERLPATYANFLIINGAVLMPAYSSGRDEFAKDALQKAFPDREVIGINCLPLIKQHGSLHCVTMQFPEGFIRKS
jgi:agmatine/peptidylarginine deiminase